MQRMWSPWRSAYIDTFNKPAKKPRRGESIFTLAKNAGDDEAHLIVWRSPHCFVIMNRFPYNSGHLMVVPNRQVSDILELSGEEWHDITEAIQRSVRALKAIMNPQGFNIGANIGRVAGAGIDDHIHFHIVPRWNGDVNFMPVLSDVKIVSEDMARTYTRLKKAFNQDAVKRPGARKTRKTH